MLRLSLRTNTRYFGEWTLAILNHRKKAHRFRFFLGSPAQACLALCLNPPRPSSFVLVFFPTSRPRTTTTTRTIKKLLRLALEAPSPGTTDRNHPNRAGFSGCRAIGRTPPECLQSRDNVRLDRAPAKGPRTAGRPTCCDRASVGSRHPSRSKRRGASATGAGGCPDESTPRKHPAAG
jgi:hypothetical protein